MKHNQAAPKSRKAVSRSSGFSLVQLMLSLAIIGTLTAALIHGVSMPTDQVASNKLKNDVRSLNSAIQIYRAFGGNLDSASNPEEVLAKLKTQADSLTAEETAGLTGSLIDRRLWVQYQSTEDADTTEPRAVWDSVAQKFRVKTDGGAGVCRFVLDEARAAEPVEEEVRVQNLKLASNSTWIWDYNDSGTYSGNAPTQIIPSGTEPGPGGGGPGGGGGTDPTPGPGNDPDPTDTLAPPAFSIPGGSYLITGFDLPLILSNPNPVGSSRIIYQVGDEGAWMQYLGGALNVAPGMRVTAVAESIVPEDWANSAPSAESYEADNLYLQTPVITTSALEFDHDANQTVVVTVNTGDDPAYASLQYRVSEGAWQDYAAPFNLNYTDYPYPLGADIEARAVATPPTYEEYYFDSDVASAHVDPAAMPLLLPVIEFDAERFGPQMSSDGDCPADGLLAEYVLQTGDFIFSQGASSTTIDITETAWKRGDDRKPYQVDFNAIVPIDRIVVKAGRNLDYVETHDYAEPIFDGTLTGPGNRKIRVIEFVCTGSSANYAPNSIVNSGVNSIEVTLTNPNPEAEGASNLRYQLVARNDIYADEYQEMPDGEDTTGFQVYAGSFSVTREEFPDGFGVLAYIESTSFTFLDSDVAYNQTAETPLLSISGTSMGTFHDPTGGSNMATNLEGDDSSSLFEWGTPAAGYDTPSWLNYTGASFTEVHDDELFYLGSIHYFNGTIYSNSGADSVGMALSLDFNGDQHHTFDFGIDLINTPNNTGSQEGDADYVKLQDLASFTPTSIYGWTFNLLIEFGEVGENGFSTIDEFHTFEGATALGHLYGTLVYTGE